MVEETVFYTSWFCPYAQRVWIALREKGVEFNLTEIDPYQPTKPGEYSKVALSLDEKRQKYPDWIAASPRGLVPALRHNGDTVCDSMVMLEFIEEVWPSAG